LIAKRLLSKGGGWLKVRELKMGMSGHKQTPNEKTRVWLGNVNAVCVGRDYKTKRGSILKGVGPFIF